MSKKFIVALHNAPNFRDPITEYLMSQGWHVWHWYADLWLISDVPDEVTSGSLHRDLESHVPGLSIFSSMVIEMGPEMKYYGRAPKADAWIWMKENWGVPEIPMSLNPGIVTGEVGVN